MILLLGTTGLLGGPVLRGLLERKLEVRAFTRGSSNWKNASVSDLRRRGVEIVLADVNDTDKLRSAMQGCQTVINLVGTFHETGNNTFEAVHLDTVREIISNAKEFGVQRIVHVSCLGASEYSLSEYLRTKWEAEQLIKKTNLYWTILKPSFLFSDKCTLIDWLKPLLKCPFFMPIPGSGVNEVQPVYADDVAQLMIDCIYDRSSVGKVLELGGPKIYAMADLMELLRAELKIAGPAVPVPQGALEFFIKTMTKIGGPSNKIVELLPLLTTDSVAVENALEHHPGIQFVSLEDRLSKILPRI
ncbi:MAG TPA: NAD(P)H-binding protein [Oculatellaceae cyanobacterium]